MSEFPEFPRPDRRIAGAPKGPLFPGMPPPRPVVTPSRRGSPWGGIAASLFTAALIGWVAFAGSRIHATWRLHAAVQRLAPTGPIEESLLTEFDGLNKTEKVMYFVMLAATAVVFAFWIGAAHRNAAAISGADLPFEPALAVGSVFIPVGNLVLPLLELQHIWKASDPADGPDRPQAKSSPAILVWWLMWIVFYVVVPPVAVSFAESHAMQITRADFTTLCLLDTVLFGMQGVTALTAAVAVRAVVRRQQLAAFVRGNATVDGFTLGTLAPSIILALAPAVLVVWFVARAETRTDYRNELARRNPPPKPPPTDADRFLEDLFDSDPNIRDNAPDRLRDVKLRPEHTDRLEKALSSPHARTRKDVADLLAGQGDEFAPFMLSLSGSTDPDRMVMVLKWLEGRRAVPAEFDGVVGRGAGHTVPPVRAAALRVLAKLEPARLAPHFDRVVEGLGRPGEVRAAAISAVAACGPLLSDSAKLGRLMEAVARTLDRFESAGMHISMQAVLRSARPQAKAAVVALASDPKPLVRGFALELLASSTDETTVLAIIDRLADEDADVRNKARRGAGRGPTTPKIVERLTRLTADPRVDVRRAALEAAATRTDSGDQFLELFRAFVGDKDPQTAAAAGNGLCHCGGAADFPKLLRLPVSSVELRDLFRGIQALAETRQAVVDALGDADVEVRRRTILLFDLVRPRTEVVDIVRTMAESDPDPNVKALAVRMLGRWRL